MSNVESDGILKMVNYSFLSKYTPFKHKGSSCQNIDHCKKMKKLAPDEN